MKCEEFEAMGLDGGRDASLGEAERAAAREHASTCARCAALLNSWQAARVELRALAEESAAAQTPARVEMRLRQEFRTRHRTLKARGTAIAAAWALAAAAVLIAAVSWVKWHDSQEIAKRNRSNPPAIAGYLPAKGGSPALNSTTVEFNAEDDSVTLVAGNETGNFTLLPGVLPADIDDAEILRVRMQRGALGAFGLPVNEDSAGEWIQVDLVVGDDGSPQAVRLLQQQ
jgi:anti-sigma factor RsiW